MVALFCLLLLVVTTIIHYEMLRGLSAWLPQASMPPRSKLVVVIFGTFSAHALEIALYAVAVLLLSRYFGLGSLGDVTRLTFGAALYFSAETFTSLGYGDILPNGALRLLAGAEALNGLLLIGWSGSYTYIAMERFWNLEVAGVSVAS